VDAAFEEPWKQGFHFAVSDKRITADDGEVQGLVDVDEL
jgi:hypothetical protein